MLLSFYVAFRSIQRQRLLSSTIILTLGLSIAVNTALFAVFDGLIFKPLPFAEADRIVHLSAPPSRFVRMPSGEVFALEEKLLSSPLLTHRVKVRFGEVLQDAFDEGNGDFIEWGLTPAYVSPDFFATLGLSPLLGRVFSEDDTLSNPRPAVIGYELWRRRFVADESIIGKILEIPGTLNHRRWTIVGVMPPNTDFPKGTNFWIPVQTKFVGYPRTPTFARLAPRVTMADVRRELPGVIVTPLREYVRPKGAYGIGMLVAAAGLLLVVAWVHAAGLLFSRLIGRTTEIGVRLALGANLRHVFWLFGCEGLLLAGSALLVATLAAPLLTKGIVDVLPEHLTIGQRVRPDLRSFGFAAALSCAALLSMLFIPITFLRHAKPVELLRNGVGQWDRIGRKRLRGLLLLAQLVVATILVYGSGVAVHSYVRLRATDLGFRPVGLVAIRIPPVGQMDSPGPEALAALNRHRSSVRTTAAMLGMLPGVQRVSGADAWPLQPLQSGPLVVESDPVRRAIDGHVGFISSGYPPVIGAQLVEGAEPTTPAPAPSRSAVGFALVNETLARRLSEFGTVIGQTIAMTPVLRYRIVGVINDIKTVPVDLPAEPTLFPYFPAESVASVLLLRVDAANPSLESSIRAVLQSTIGDRSKRELLQLTTVAEKATSDHRARAILLIIVSAQALLLTTIGVAGAVGYASQQQSKHIAIELALGAEPTRVRWRLIRSFATTTGFGIVIGLMSAIILVRVASTYLYEIHLIDAPTVIAAIVVLMTAIVLAAWVPVKRATWLDVMTTLRNS